MAIAEGAVDISNQEVKKPERKTFDDTPVRRIKMKLNQVIRITILEETTQMRLRHFMKGKGYTRCLSYQGWCPSCIAAEKGSPYKVEGMKRASEVFGVNVFQFETEDRDNDPAALKDKKLKGDVYMFAFGSEKFTAIRSIKQMYGTLIGVDLQITCTDEDFQKMSITAYPEKSWYASQEKVKAYIEKKYAEQKYPIEKLLCKEVNPKQMIELYGLNPALLDTPECKSIMLHYTSAQEESKPKDDDAISMEDEEQSESIASSSKNNIQSSGNISDAEIVEESKSKVKEDVKIIASDSLLDEL